MHVFSFYADGKYQRCVLQNVMHVALQKYALFSVVVKRGSDVSLDNTGVRRTKRGAQVAFGSMYGSLFDVNTVADIDCVATRNF